MSSKGDKPPPYCEKVIIALFGKRVQLKNAIGKMILSPHSAFKEVSNNVVVETDQKFKIINTPDFFEEECPNLDQMIVDFMAHSHPGPNLFILAVDSENAQKEKVVAQIIKLQEIFGENITANLVIMLQDIESFHSLKNTFGEQLVNPAKHLTSDCLGRRFPSFQYDYKNYSEDVVKRRKAALEKGRYDAYPLHHHGREAANSMTPSTSRDSVAATAAPEHHIAANSMTPSTSRDSVAAAAAPEHHIGKSACDESNNTFNIVLLGPSGTGKSASANTLLTAWSANVDSRNLFKSEASSVPTTKQCKVVPVEKHSRTMVRLVDTPDFFHDQLGDSQAQVDECKRYCQLERCVVLLVLQLGRFTDSDGKILQKLEDKFGWKIRENTFVLLTHGEDLEGSLEEYIRANDGLRSLIELCGNRYHLFKNNSKNSKQVKELIKKIQNCTDNFPIFDKKQNDACCVV